MPPFIFVASIAAVLVTGGEIGWSANFVLRAGLAAVVLVSGLGKFADLAGTRQAMGDFGVPPRWVSSAGVALPLLELMLGCALLVDPLSRVAGYALAALMLIFAGGLANLLRQKRRPPCHCFGAVHSAPVGVETLLRALSLALLALLSARLPIYPVARLWPWVLTGVFVLVLGSGWAIRRKRGLGVDAGRLLVGQRLPAVRLTSGEWLHDLLPPHTHSLLVVLSHGCGACQELERNLVQWTQALGGLLPIIPIFLNDGDRRPALERGEFALLRSSTPGGILVGPDASVLQPPVGGGEQIEALIRVALSAQYSKR